MRTISFGRYCTRCSARHNDALHKWCKPCRVLGADRLREYRHDHIKRKLCPKCVQDKGRVTQHCEYHRRYVNEHRVAAYWDQREKGLCGYGRCPEVAENAFCDKHAKQSNAYKVKVTRRPRTRWAA